MTVQAAGVRSLLKPEQEREREALEIIEQTGREALAEMRRLVGVLRRPEEGPALAPQPSLEHVEKLISQAREAGLPVELRVEGDPVQLPAGVDLTAYRLVQEGLTKRDQARPGGARRGRRPLRRRARRADGQRRRAGRR
jgi:signal transduction histidine kinase